MRKLPFNQVHLDYHNGDDITDIGKDFNEEDFISSLKSSCVESVALFAKCHHGNFYYYTDKFKRHPHLACNLLKRQFDACRKNGIRASVYISAGIDEYYAKLHKEDCFVQKDGKYSWSPDFETAGFHLLCFNSPYLDFLAEQTEEVVSKFDADEVFFDICSEKVCYCKHCTETLISEGKELTDENYAELARRTYKKYYERVNGIVRKYLPRADIFHNGGGFIRGRRDLMDADTVLEIEALPTGHWGYDNFPMAVAYIKNIGKDYVGMTGKFHTEWGEFGGYKHPNALKYEAALAIANGAKFSVGDQLHPSGTIDPLTYEIIGNAFSYIKERKEYCEDVMPVAQIGVLSVETNKGGYNEDSDVGINRILLEKQYLYAFLDKESDFSKYDVLVLPDCIESDDELKEKLKNFVSGGGKLLCSGKSGIGLTYLFDLGIKNLQCNSYERNYFVPEIKLKSFSKKGTFIVYSDTLNGEPTGRILGNLYNPYFNRTVEHFCSHMHAPANYSSPSTFVTIGKDGGYIPYDIFADYAANGELFQKELADEMIKILIDGKKIIDTDICSGGVVVFGEQSRFKRYILHALYAPLSLRGRKTQVIEDITPLYNVKFSLTETRRTVKIEYVPEHKEIPFTNNGDKTEFEIDVNCHSMVAIYYE